MTPGNSENSLTEQEYILRAKQEWEQTFDAVSDLIFFVNNEFTIVRANRAMADRCGLTPMELVGHKCFELMHGTNAAPDYCPHASFLECGKSQTMEIAAEKLHGTFEVTMSPVFNAEGRITASVHVARDVTEKRKIEKALLESEQRFSVFMKHLPLAVSIKDDCGRFLFANEYMKDLLCAENLIGKTVGDLLPQDVAVNMEHDDQEAFTQGLGLYKDIISDRNGNKLVLDTYKFPIPLSDGTTLLGTISVDITEKTRQEEMLAAQQIQLMDLNNNLEFRISETVAEMRKKDDILIKQSRLTAMGEMISNIAHQWRQPLNNIGLNVQNLKLAFKANDLSVEEMDENIAETMNILRQISETIDDFRNFFSHEEEARSFDINDLVSRSLSFVAPSLKSKGIRLEVDGQSDKIVEGYPNEYMQAFLNIITNARDALLEQQVQDPFIRIRIFQENGRSIVTVRDNGGGIREDILPNIYDPYFSTKKLRNGTGLGLYMAKMIIEKKMHGCLSACSVDGGTEFRIEV